MGKIQGTGDAANCVAWTADPNQVSGSHGGKPFTHCDEGETQAVESLD